MRKRKHVNTAEKKSPTENGQITGDIATIAQINFMKEYDETEEEKEAHLRRVEWDKKCIQKMKEYRKAVRRDFFRRKAIYDKFATFLCRTGVFTSAELPAGGSERSVAGPGQRTFGGQSLPPHTGAEKK